MRQRSTASGNGPAARRGKTASRKRRVAPKAKSDRAPSAARLKEQLDRRTRELNEALEQQTATSEVLRVISSFPGDLGKVFDSLLDNAIRICEASFGNLWLCDTKSFRVAATRGASASARRTVLTALINFNSKHPLARLAHSKQVEHVPDIRTEEAYIEGDAPLVRLADNSAARTLLLVPMLKDRELIGAISIYRQEVRPFTDKQIALVQNFAAQAVIAIENARLLNELRARTDDLNESLQRQTATAEVLSVISGSPGDLEPVFRVILENATRICEAKFAHLELHEDGSFRIGAMYNMPRTLADAVARREPGFRPGPSALLSRIAASKRLLHISDLIEDVAYKEHVAGAVRLVELGSARTLVGVPMLKDDVLVGAILIYRQEVRPFTDKQIELVQNFAAQAVIAIENARLLNELRQRTDDLTESLEQQTATAEVLRVISSSPGELEPVFQAVLANAVRICDARFGTLFQYDNELFDVVASFGAPPNLVEFHRERGPFRPASGTGLDRMLQTKSVVRIEDEGAEPSPSAAARLVGARSLIRVPMLKENKLIGAITIYRQEVRPFTDKQIALVQNFAAQAVIAIENTRLLNELRESLERQTATSQVLQVISSSPGELNSVFAAILENATRLCEAKFGLLYRHDGKTFAPAAEFGATPELTGFIRQRGPFLPPPGGPLSPLAHKRRGSSRRRVCGGRQEPGGKVWRCAIFDFRADAQRR